MDPFTVPTEEGIEHMQNDMDRILALFSSHVERNRGKKLAKPIRDIAQGDVWQGVDALPLGLVDVLQTSEEYINSRMDEGAECYAISKLSSKKMRSPLRKLFNPDASSSSVLEQPDLANLMRNHSDSRPMLK